MRVIRQLVLLVLIGASCCVSLWVVLGSFLPKTTLALTAVIMFFLAAPIGALWMLYDCFRYEKPTFPYLLFALLPYAFVWHYFEHVRPRNKLARA